MMKGQGDKYREMLYSRRKDFSLVVFFFRNFRAIFVPFERKKKKKVLYICFGPFIIKQHAFGAQLTSDLVDDQVHLAIGPFAQLSNHLVVLVNLQLLQVLSSDQLQLIQDVHVSLRGAHAGECFKDGLVVGDPENGFSDETSEVVSNWCHYKNKRRYHFKHVAFGTKDGL